MNPDHDLMEERLWKKGGWVARVVKNEGDDGVSMRADLDLIPDDDDPHAILTVRNDATGEVARSKRVAAGYRLTAASLSQD